MTECLVVEDDGYFLDFSRFKEYLFISLKFLFRARECRGAFTDIDLRCSSSVAFAGVADAESHLHLAAFWRGYAEIRELEGGVAESEAEGVEREGCVAVVASVANKDSLVVADTGICAAEVTAFLGKCGEDAYDKVP